MGDIRSELKDPRRFTNNNPKRNMIIDTAVAGDSNLLSTVLENAIKSGQEKTISVAINLAPSVTISSLINQEMVKVFYNTNFEFYVFSIPFLVISDNLTESTDVACKSDLLINLLKNYGVLYCKNRLLNDFHDLSLCELYELQSQSDINNLISWCDNIKEDKKFIHKSASSALEIRYLIGITDKKDIFHSDIIKNHGLEIMDILDNDKLLAIPLLIDSIAAVINQSRFFFLESIFNIEISDTVKSIRMSNNSRCYAVIKAVNDDHEGMIVLRLYKQMLNNLANYKESDLMLKELRWPLTVLDDFNEIADRILRLLSAIQIETKIITT